MSFNFYLPTDLAAESILKAISEIEPVNKRETLQPSKTYRLTWGWGTYFIKGEELQRLKGILDGLDAKDNNQDGLMNSFYKPESTSLFNAKQWNHSVVGFKYERFVPKDTSQYQATLRCISGLFRQGKITWNIMTRNTPLTASPDDLHSLTVLALLNNYSAPVFDEIEKDLKGKEDYRFFVQAHGISAGIASYDSETQSPSRAMGFSLGASTMYGFQDSKNPREAVREMRTWIKHERGHGYLRKIAREHGTGFQFVDVIAIYNNESGLKQKIQQQIQPQQGAIDQWEWFSQEICDPIFFKRISQHHYNALRETCRKGLDENLETLSIEGANFYRETFNQIGYPSVMKAAFNICLYRYLGLDKAKVDQLDVGYRYAFAPDRLNQLALYETMIKWFKLALRTGENAELQRRITNLDPAFFRKSD